MRKEVVYGVVPLFKVEGEWQTFIVEHQKGNFWGFPKGHPEGDESEKGAATRELFEECALEIETFIGTDPLFEKYQFEREGESIEKEAYYFLAIVKEQTFSIDGKEILNGRWLSFEQAAKLITFEQSRRVCVEAKKQIEAL